MSEAERTHELAAGPVVGGVAVTAGRRWLVAVMLLVAVGLVRAPTFVHQLFDQDEASIAVQATTVMHGGTLYVDVVDRKPPLPPLIYATVFRLTGTHDLRPLHGLVAVAIALSAVVLAREARRRAGERAALWAAVLTVGGAAAFVPVDAGAANYAHFALLPGTVAVAWAGRGTSWRAAFAGVALGIAILCRQSWVLGLVPAAGAAALSGRRRDALVLLAGVTATVGAAAFVVPFGPFLRWTFTGNAGLLLARTNVAAAGVRGLAAVGLFTAFHLSLVGLVVLALQQVRRAGRFHRADIALWLWLLSALVAVAIGFRFFGHYWYQVLPPAVLLAAPVAAELRGGWRRLAVAGLVLPTVFAVAMACAPGMLRQRPDAEPLALAVRARTDVQDRVFVWGAYPEVLWEADREPGGGLVHTDFLTGRSDRPDDAASDPAPPPADLYAQVLHELEADPPALVLDTSTSAELDYTAYPMVVLPQLAEWVQANYRPVEVVGEVTVYARLQAAGRTALRSPR